MSGSDSEFERDAAFTDATSGTDTGRKRQLSVAEMARSLERKRVKKQTTAKSPKHRTVECDIRRNSEINPDRQ